MTRIITIILVSGFSVGLLFAQQTGSLKGRVIASDDQSGLPYANVVVVGTYNGVSADVDGNFFLRNIEAGRQQIKFTYIGYREEIKEIVIQINETAEIEVALQPGKIEIQAIEVTAQTKGQLAAINNQIRSNTIKNVVAPDRLQENPDANAAEAIGRLPGISLIRSGGEGTGVVIRGLDPKYTKVLLDGIPIPSTDDNTRATSVAGISQYSLQGVEVFKSVTPDMESDAVAGVINLQLIDAPKGLKYSILAQGGYNHLNNYWKNYKFVGDASNRFFNDNLGVILSLNAERMNRSAQTLGAGYGMQTVPPPGQLAPLFVNNINLNIDTRVNNRISGSLLLDYQISSTTKIFFSNFYSHSDQNYTTVNKSYGINNGIVNYYIGDTPHNLTEIYMGSLKAKHQLPIFELEEGISFSQSHAYFPDSRLWIFSLTNPGLKNYGNQAVQSLPLNEILAGATDSLSATTLNNFQLHDLMGNADDLIEKHVDVYVNSKISFKLENFVSGYIKSGVKYKQNSRKRYYSRMSQSQITSIQDWGLYATESLPWAGVTENNNLSMQGLNESIITSFLKGQYNFGWYPNISRLNELFDWWSNFSNYYLNVDPKNIPPQMAFEGRIGFNPDWVTNVLNSQKINETYYAAYLMGEFNFGDIVTLIPGVRYEKIKDNLSGYFVEVARANLYSKTLPGYLIDSTQNNEFLLPLIHLKIKPTDWFQSLLSFTQTLKRPDFNQLTPYQNLYRGPGPLSYSSGNPSLRPEIWTNYDAQFAIFGNEIGLVSISGFYKKVKDMIWIPSIYRVAGQPFPYGIEKYFSNNATVLITVPQNHSFPIYLKGFEFELQTNLWYLPEPFKYISLNANFTFIDSETKYKYSKTVLNTIGIDNRGRPITQLAVIDSIYSGPMLNQPKSIANFSFGYNYSGFNLWLSYQYTGSMITTQPPLKEFENHVSKFSKWDLQISQKLPINGLEVLFNYANINNPIGYQNNLADNRPSYLESYGWTMDFGIRYRL